MSLAQRSDVEERKAAIRQGLGLEKDKKSFAQLPRTDAQGICLDELEGRDVSSDDLLCPAQ